MDVSKLVYHGSNKHQIENNSVVFYSESKLFASGYGNVTEHNIEIIDIFDTGNKEHVEDLLSKVGYLFDGYSKQEFETWQEYEAANLIASDTWETFEDHINLIKGMRYNGMIIYEGGYKNYIVFM